MFPPTTLMLRCYSLLLLLPPSLLLLQRKKGRLKRRRDKKRYWREEIQTDEVVLFVCGRNDWKGRKTEIMTRYHQSTTHHGSTSRIGRASLALLLLFGSYQLNVAETNLRRGGSDNLQNDGVKEEDFYFHHFLQEVAMSIPTSPPGASVVGDKIYL